MTDIFGQDIALDTSGQPLVASTGELVLTEGVATGLQDIRLRLTTYIGSLFYDKSFGSTLPDWMQDENDALARIGFAAEVKRCIGTDPRVTAGSTACTVLDWDENSLSVRAAFGFIDDDHVYNLVIDVDRSKKEMVIQDVDPAVV